MDESPCYEMPLGPASTHEISLILPLFARGEQARSAIGQDYVLGNNCDLSPFCEAQDSDCACS
jgi:hypothetical protein